MASLPDSGNNFDSKVLLSGELNKEKIKLLGGDHRWPDSFIFREIDIPIACVEIR